MSLRKALYRHGGDGFTVHGFRSAFRDWGGERTNAPRELLEVALAHAIGNADRSGLCARRPAGEAAPHHAAMGRRIAPRRPRLPTATRWWRSVGAVAMDDTANRSSPSTDLHRVGPATTSGLLKEPSHRAIKSISARSRRAGSIHRSPPTRRCGSSASRSARRPARNPRSQDRPAGAAWQRHGRAGDAPDRQRHGSEQRALRVVARESGKPRANVLRAYNAARKKARRAKRRRLTKNPTCSGACLQKTPPARRAFAKNPAPLRRCMQNTPLRFSVAFQRVESSPSALS